MPVSALYPRSLSSEPFIPLSFSVSSWNLACSPLPQLPLSPVAISSSVNGVPWWLSDKESSSQCRRQEFDPWTGKSPWRRKWQPTPVFLPGKSHGQRSLMGYSPWGRKESDTPEHAHTSVNGSGALQAPDRKLGVDPMYPFLCLLSSSISCSVMSCAHRLSRKVP